MGNGNGELFDEGRKALAMARQFKVGDFVEWDGGKGQVRHVLLTPTLFRGDETVHATQENPAYMIKTNTTDRLLVRSGAGMTKIRGGEAGRKKEIKISQRRRRT